jgi:dipeptidase D
MMVLENLYPQRVFYFFEQIAGIPHGSRNTKAISDYLAAFAKERGLSYVQDESNNVVIIGEATAGYEDAEPIIIQGHMDMVCEKESDCDIDFEKEGLRLYVDGDFVKAKGTTLGGDDGIAVAYALALLDSDEIAHPRLEVIVTVDEEIGLLGAKSVDLSMLKGHTMLNLDSEEEGIFLIGCAGGMSVNQTIPVTRTAQSGHKLTITVTGLVGGHSGTEIDKEHGNADILMGRVLKGIFDATPFGILTLAGGGKDNAIPRACTAEILVPEESVGVVTELADQLKNDFSKEFYHSDPDVTIVLEDGGSATEEILDFGSVNKVIYYLRSVPNGILHMSQELPGLVETSLNLGIMELNRDELHLVTSIRSSVGTRKDDLCDRVIAIVEMLGGEAVVEGDYPAWEYKPESKLRPQIAAVYEEQYGKKPEFTTIHAGLECGLLSQKIADLDCVSFGPNILDIHTPKERLSIASTGRVWDFIVEFLRRAK